MLLGAPMAVNKPAAGTKRAALRVRRPDVFRVWKPDMRGSAGSTRCCHQALRRASADDGRARVTAKSNGTKWRRSGREEPGELLCAPFCRPRAHCIRKPDTHSMRRGRSATRCSICPAWLRPASHWAEKSSWQSERSRHGSHTARSDRAQPALGLDDPNPLTHASPPHAFVATVEGPFPISISERERHGFSYLLRPR